MYEKGGGNRGMIFSETKLKGAFIIDLEPHNDTRGFFARTFCQQEFIQRDLNPIIGQTNIAFNKKKGTLRGMHFQYPPHAETKLVRCTRGSIIDIIVDLRPESSTYLDHIAVKLTASNARSLYVPERFAHGYQVLEDDTETSYQVGEFYTPSSEGGLLYEDPWLGLNWPLQVTEISSKDKDWKLLAEIEPDLRRRMTPAAHQILYGNELSGRRILQIANRERIKVRSLARTQVAITSERDFVQGQRLEAPCRDRTRLKQDCYSIKRKER
jgi:dTDP-4-dehydrorhamnose 3,5-epimerase